MTCRRSRRHSGSSHQQARPTQSHSVERSRSIPCRAKIPAWRYKGRKSAYLATSTCASSASVAIPPVTGRSGSGRLHHRLLAGPAAVARAADHPHPQLGGDDVEHLARVLADDVQGPAAAGAALVLDVDQDLDPRQVRRQGAQVAPARTRGVRGVPLLAAASSCAASAAATVCSRSSRPSWSWSGSSFSERRPNRPRCSCRIKQPQLLDLRPGPPSRSDQDSIALDPQRSDPRAFCRATTSVICRNCGSSRSGSRGRSSSASDMPRFYWPYEPEGQHFRSPCRARPPHRAGPQPVPRQALER